MRLDTTVYFVVYIAAVRSVQKPNIVIVLVDDMGWNDVSFHGSDQIPTPNIDALAYNGIILNRFYTQPSCTPSRSALLTGHYPIRHGFQGFVMRGGENRFLPHDIKLLPEKLHDLGYSTNLIGKWHLGYAYKNVTPTYRGFDYHYGYWNGVIGYFDHCAQETNITGFDMHQNLDAAWETQNEYATRLFSRKSEEVIIKHNLEKPLFLMVSHLAVHAGKRGVVYEVPDQEDNNKKFGYIKEPDRRKFAGMVDELDKSVGELVQALKRKGILDDTVIMFVSDNGGQTVGDVQKNSGSNWPLRGTKFTTFEGGIRNVAFVYYSKMPHKNLINNDFMHITDIYPTLVTAAGGNTEGQTFDGIDQWNTIMQNQKSARNEILVNVEEVENWSAVILDGYKLINGSGGFNQTLEGFYGDDGRGAANPPYDPIAVLTSPANEALNSSLNKETVLRLRTEADLGNCRIGYNNHHCNEGNLCLFDLINDPCETINLVEEHPDIVKKLSDRLSYFWEVTVPQKNLPYDPRSNPACFNNTWSTWLEEENDQCANSTLFF